MLDLPPGVRGGDLRPLFESVEAAFYASSPGKHFLGRREDSAAIIFGESEGTARPQTRAWGQGRKKANGEEGNNAAVFKINALAARWMSAGRHSSPSLGQVAGHR